MGLEGIVAKRSDSPYRSGYSADWLKVRVDRSSDFAVIGFEPAPEGGTGLRRLHLAVVGEAAGLVYAGTVGTGFSREEEAELRARLEPLRRATPPLADGRRPRHRLGRARGGRRGPLQGVDRRRAPAPPRLPAAARRQDGRRSVSARARNARTEEAEAAGAAAGDRASPPAFTNLDKVFWPEEGITKGDLIEYYRAVAPAMLPFLRDRPLVLDRYPDGIAGKSFFQKNAPAKPRAGCARWW